MDAQQEIQAALAELDDERADALAEEAARLLQQQRAESA
jgi:hypothetical protein